MITLDLSLMRFVNLGPFAGVASEMVSDRFACNFSFDFDLSFFVEPRFLSSGFYLLLLLSDGISFKVLPEPLNYFTRMNLLGFALI